MNCRICAKDILHPPDEFIRNVSPTWRGTIEPFDRPTLCLDCRLRRRLAFRNERFLFRRECAATKRTIISVFPPESEAVVYYSDSWRSDSWDARTYAEAPDPVLSVFSQFKRLLCRVPLEALYINDSENSDYTNFAGYNKNTYLLFNSGHNQDCYYARGLYESQDCADMYYCQRCRFCYECINCNNCYALQNSTHCAQCHDSYFLHDCLGCSNCIACVNLRHKTYHLFNQAVTKAEFERVKATLDSHQLRQELAQKFQKLVSDSWQRGSHLLNTENSSGDFLSNCHNCHECFESYGCQDSFFCDSVKPGKNLYACIGSCIDSEILYETIGIGKSYRVAFSFNGSGLSDVYYSAFCQSSKHLFACIGIKNAEYCIFNKQYTQREYEEILPTLITKMRHDGEWGLFFDPRLSHYNYNQTVAFEYYPCAREQALTDGYIWREQTAIDKPDRAVIDARELPDRFMLAQPELESKLETNAIRCPASGDCFKLTKAEITFYEAQNIPLPRFHPDVRHARRIEVRGMRSRIEAKCAGCSQIIKASSSKTALDKLLCEKCFASRVNVTIQHDII